MVESTETLISCPFSSQYRIPTSQAWRLLGIFFLYRVVIALLFSGLFFFAVGPSQFGKYNADLYALTSGIYLALTIVAGLLLILRWPSFSVQAQMHLLTDLFGLTLLMHSSGGIQSGIGVLLAVSVAAGGLLVGGRCSLVFAAIATLLILIEQVYSDYVGAFEKTTYTYAGMLGASFFTISLLAHVLTARAEESAAIAARRGVDVDNLQQLNEYVIQHLHSGIIVLDQDHHIRMMNDSSRRLFRLQSSPQNLNDISAELDNQYQDWLTHHVPATVELKIDDSYRLNIQFNNLGHPNNVFNMILVEDLALSNQRVQQSKLASLGRLSASIAHEIRNPLGAISHASQLLAECPDLGDSDLRLTEIIRNHTNRVNTIIQNVLQLSRRSPSQLEDIELGAWLERFLQEFYTEHQVTESAIKLVFEIADPHVRIDQGQLKQILGNLCINAMKYGGNGRDTIQLGIIRDNQRVCVEVRDRGPGISAENIDRIFEPFFTTSTSGTGLGLYISRELAELNQASLEYRPMPEGGSCFRLVLPDAKQAVMEI